MTTTDRYVTLERDGVTATIVLDHAGTDNAWTLESARQLTECADRLRFDSGARVVILRAEGPSFCAGADWADVAGGTVGRSAGQHVRNWFEQLRWLHERMEVLAQLPQPVIVAIQGACLGMGLEVAMMGDIRVAAGDAEFGFPEAALGVSPSAGGDLRVAAETGAGWAKLLAFTGRRIDAGTARRIGIVQQVVTPHELSSTVGDLAAEIAANAPLAVQGIKRTINFFSERGFSEARRVEAASASVALVSDDMTEGLQAQSGGTTAIFEGK